MIRKIVFVFTHTTGDKFEDKFRQKCISFMNYLTTKKICDKTQKIPFQMIDNDWVHKKFLLPDGSEWFSKLLEKIAFVCTEPNSKAVLEAFTNEETLSLGAFKLDPIECVGNIARLLPYSQIGNDYVEFYDSIKVFLDKNKIFGSKVDPSRAVVIFHKKMDALIKHLKRPDCQATINIYCTFTETNTLFNNFKRDSYEKFYSRIDKRACTANFHLELANLYMKILSKMISTSYDATYALIPLYKAAIANHDKTTSAETLMEQLKKVYLNDAIYVYFKRTIALLQDTVNLQDKILKIDVKATSTSLTKAWVRILLPPPSSQSLDDIDIVTDTFIPTIDLLIKHWVRDSANVNY